MCSTKAHGGPHCLYASMSDEATLDKSEGNCSAWRILGEKILPKIFNRFRDREIEPIWFKLQLSVKAWLDNDRKHFLKWSPRGSSQAQKLTKTPKSTRTTDRKEAVMWVGASEILIIREVNIVWKSSMKMTYWACERYESSWKGILSHWFGKYFWVQRVQGLAISKLKNSVFNSSWPVKRLFESVEFPLEDLEPKPVCLVLKLIKTCDLHCC